MSKKGPIIALPKDPERIEQLKRKLEEYDGRIQEHVSPELQAGDICKRFVLEKLLQEKEIDTFTVCAELFAKYGSIFSEEEFNTACAVIEDYCETGGKNVNGGTGLN